MIATVLRKVQEWKERITVRDINEVIRIKQRQMESLAHEINVLNDAMRMMQDAEGPANPPNPGIPAAGTVLQAKPPALVPAPTDAKRWP